MSDPAPVGAAAAGFWAAALAPANPSWAWPLWWPAASPPANAGLPAWLWLLACAPALALCIDRLLGEPPMRWHPVVWMGHYLARTGARAAPLAPPAVQAAPPGRAAPADWPAFWRGALAWLAGAAWFTGAAWLLQAWLLSQPAWLAALALGLFLKPMLAWAMLHDEVLAVEGALTQSLAAGRQQLARLVSRDVTRLNATQVRESAIESLAENLNDSVIAPLFWFVLLGLPGAVLYRYANTADAMWGYHGVRPLGGAPRQWAWAGKWAARADDVLSWLPARLTALLLGAVATRRLPWRRLPREAAQTPSPNSGWPMATLALLLDVRLAKPGVYTLHAAGRLPGPQDLLRACALGSRATLAATLLASLGLLALLALRA